MCSAHHAGDRKLKIGIAGAGLLGRLVAWTLAHQGHQVSVFDPAPGPQPAYDGHGAAGFTAAGMLSPLAELETAERDVAERGWHSITRWEQIAGALARRTYKPPYFARRGLVVADQRVVPLRQVHGMRQALMDHHAVGQLGEHVVRGHLLHLFQCNLQVLALCGQAISP